MGVFKVRRRMVSFRLSDEEYERLQYASRAEGAHSISDYARVTLCKLLPREAVSGSSGGDRITLSETAHHLEYAIQHLISTLDGMRSSVAKLVRSTEESG